MYSFLFGLILKAESTLCILDVAPGGGGDIVLGEYGEYWPGGYWQGGYWREILS